MRLGSVPGDLVDETGGGEDCLSGGYVVTTSKQIKKFLSKL